MGHVVPLCLHFTFWVVFLSVYTIFHLHEQCEKGSVSPNAGQQPSLIKVILVDVKWCLYRVWIFFFVSFACDGVLCSTA